MAPNACRNTLGWNHCDHTALPAKWAMGRGFGRARSDEVEEGSGCVVRTSVLLVVVVAAMFICLGGRAVIVRVVHGRRAAEGVELFHRDLSTLVWVVVVVVVRARVSASVGGERLGRGTSTGRLRRDGG